jgi:hypothetical protein
MFKAPWIMAAFLGLAASATAQDLSWRNGIGTLIQDKCEECHGASRPEYQDWNLGDKKKGSRIVSYADFMSYVMWPATGAVMRRLDDGKSNADGKAGNMYEHLGETDAERAENLAKIKTWLGEGAWNQNRWGARGSVPAVTKDQLDKVKAKY